MARNLVARGLGRLRERKGTRAVRLAVEAPGGAPPIFVVGCHRSGTSLLRRILDSHSRIACPPESKFLLPLVGVLADRQSVAGLDSMGYGRDEVVKALAAFARTFFDGYAAARGKPRWADKTPNYVDILPVLPELFPGARFVIIYRHGMDVAYSLAQREYGAVQASIERAGGDVPIGAARFWVEQNEKILAFRAAHADACHEVRYETLTTEPAATLQPMFAFLGEPWEPQVMEYGKFEHDRGFEDPDVRRRGRIVPNSGRFREWPDDVQAAVRETCAPMLARLEYA